MSTAGRPTYFSAVGRVTQSSNAPTFKVSAKDQNAHMTLKFRKFGQASSDELKYKNFTTDLNQKVVEEVKKEKNNSIEYITNSESRDPATDSSIRLLTNEPSPFSVESDTQIKNKYDDEDADARSQDDEDSTFSSSDEDDDDDDDDDELELRRELEKIKAERQIAQQKKEEEERVQREKEKMENAIRGNPLLATRSDQSLMIKRKWNDDVVFRNQAKDEPELKKRFINDTIRNDFHRMFLKKYVK